MHQNTDTAVFSKLGSVWVAWKDRYPKHSISDFQLAEIWLFQKRHKKKFGVKKMWSTKKFSPKKCWSLKYFGPKINVGPEKKLLVPQQIVGPENSLVSKEILFLKKKLVPQKIVSQNFFGNLFLSQDDISVVR